MEPSKHVDAKCFLKTRNNMLKTEKHWTGRGYDVLNDDDETIATFYELIDETDEDALRRAQLFILVANKCTENSNNANLIRS